MATVPASSVTCGRLFGLAVCEHFALPAGKCTGVQVHTESDEMFGVSVRIVLTPDDLEAIAKRMAGKQKTDE